MKRSISTAILAALALAACSDSEETDDDARDAAADAAAPDGGFADARADAAIEDARIDADARVMDADAPDLGPRPDSGVSGSGACENKPCLTAVSSADDWAFVA